MLPTVGAVPVALGQVPVSSYPVGGHPGATCHTAGVSYQPYPKMQPQVQYLQGQAVPQGLQGASLPTQAVHQVLQRAPLPMQVMPLQGASLPRQAVPQMLQGASLPRQAAPQVLQGTPLPMKTTHVLQAAPLPWHASNSAQLPLPPTEAQQQSPNFGTPIMTASMVFDGEAHEVRYGPGLDFESPADFFTPCRKAWREPYQAMLDFLDAHGWFERLPVDAKGILHITLPFCGSVQEVPVLADFLCKRFLGKPGINQISILGTDLYDWNQKGGYWKEKERFVARKYPGLQLKFCQMDLTKAQHPESALTLGIHPECTVETDLWRMILSNVIGATTGTCLISTFKDMEMEMVQSLCKDLGVEFEVHRNPYWVGREAPEGTIPPFLSYFILIRKGGR
eukprot:TRINITY_DN42353_c0_g1_i1.p1 TRINITY_DN42353_c0_g1~~TRINITY_DN42353_c0_g1_i1.p1  ORF type:complete len:394 (+),score=62.75 TRINITY_DN42353_c0_g1_i1:54-1235(+)